MKIRTLLLGTATAFAAVNGAQAADLAVAEPVDYVKVCDAYGAGYFYIPGSDTCLKIGGFVEGWIDFYGNSAGRDYNNSSYSANWDWNTRTSLQVTAQSMTDIGLLTAFAEYRVNTDNASYLGENRLAYFDSAYLKAGPLKIGNFSSIYYYGGAFGEFGPGADYDAVDQNYDQLAFSTSMGGLGFTLGIADPRDVAGGAGSSAGNWPDIIATLTGTSGGFDWKLAAAATDTIYGTGYGVQLAGTYTAAGGDAIRAKFAFGNGEGAAYVDNTAPVNGGTWWSALVSGVHYWSSTVNTSASVMYVDQGGPNLWNAGLETDWLVAKNFLTGIGVDYVDKSYASSTWQVQILAKRTF